MEALRPLVAEAGLVDGLSDLVRLFDGLRVPKPVSLGDTRLERTRMFEAARLLIERACNRLPVAILIDDVHWADRGIARNEESVLVGEDLLRLLMAIQMCWGNLVAARASAEEGIRLARPPEPSRKRLAVLVQPMVAGTAAGVAFPANPATGERNRVLIDAIAGLGEQPALCAATPEGSFQETSSRASRCSFRPHHDPRMNKQSRRH